MTDDRHGAEPADDRRAERITSLANARVKAAVRLRERGERDTTGLTIVDGAREILRALDAGTRIETAFVAPELIRTSDGRAVLDRIGHAPSTLDVSPTVLAKLAYGDRSDGVVAIVEVPGLGLDQLVLPPGPLVVVAEAVEKPGNLGAILRSADAAGAAAFIAADPLTDVFNPNAIRSSLGTIFSLPIAVATAAETRGWLLDRAITPIAAVVDAGTPYTAVDLTGSVAIVLGSEAAGLSATWRDARVTRVSIPMAGVADSLNVSVAAAVLLFEAVRQRAGGQRSVTSDAAH
jgi:RNA methyltransferase, TrmH family